MSNVCCKELQGWCKSFTKTEIFLCVLQAIFFVVFVASLTFLILHLVVCSRSKQKNEILHPSRTETNNTDKNKEYEYITDSIKDFIGIGTTSDQKYEFTQTIQTNNSDIAEVNKSLLKVTTAVDKGVTCTWKPSLQTKAPTHYYEYHSNMTTSVVENQNKQMTEVNINGINSIDFENEAGLEDNKLQEDLPDGAEINVTRQYFIIALVKIKPRAITFGCTLTIVSEYWTITVASCIEAIEEGDSLDSFVMMRGFKEQDQNIYPVAEVMIHPQYQGVNVTFDLAALKSEGRLVKEGNLVLKLPSLVDNFLEYFLITIGEALTVFGYGRFGNIDEDHIARSVRAVTVHCMPLSECERGAGSGAERGAGSWGWGWCAGALRARTAPCSYRAGAPLVRRGVLLGLMADSRRRGGACEPALFVNLARGADWLPSVLAS